MTEKEALLILVIFPAGAALIVCGLLFGILAVEVFK